MADPYFSEIKYLGGRDLDFIEVAVDQGADISELVVTIYLPDGTIRSSNPLEGLEPTQSGGSDVYIIDTTTRDTFNGLGKTNALSLSDGSGVHAFYSFNDRSNPITAVEGPATGMTSTQIGKAGGGHSLETEDRGASYQVQTDPNPGTITCLTRGTQVQTPDGPVAVEDLRPEQLICTYGGGAQPLVSVLSRTVSAAQMRRAPNLYPVRIAAGALGTGLPERDLLVSRQHRMLIASPIVKRMFSVAEVLVAAIRLVSLPGITVDRSVREVTYVHLLFARHEVIFAEGSPTESLLLGPEALKAMDPAARAELQTLFPEALTQAASPGRVIPPGAQQKLLIARHAANRKPLLQGEGGRP
ncbi:MAG: Hint domain-containing protein [Pseudomonadota bacterium]